MKGFGARLDFLGGANPRSGHAPFLAQILGAFIRRRLGSFPSMGNGYCRPVSTSRTADTISVVNPGVRDLLSPHVHRFLTSFMNCSRSRL
ncbi:hypothetical protein chiPu_0001881 [Chiloscyllium punctatum]|uniref:Uncharacterized protein n=1 Tax=Chiloscyllium punctatum TaxID=137246 RepID=A0A401RZA5_CHIPU|nr:hypothetical protein [Chiloscyllium punctatum]